MAMEPVSVATLKSNLSRYLAAAKNGEEVVITSHGRPIARLALVQKAVADDLKIISAKKPVSSLKKIKGMNRKFDLVADLAD
jgi:antitoxin (DNA-binding transcriptional repressor) of toxin-antitoxin stability system